MPIVGIDCGTTLTKFAWLDPDTGMCTFARASTTLQRRKVVNALYKKKIHRANLTGIGSRDGLEGLKPVPPSGKAIEVELQTQAEGARRILGMSAMHLEEDFLLVSIGTGTSFVIVRKDGSVSSVPFGRALGGGFIMGLARAMRLTPTLDALGMHSGNILDIFLSDLLSESEIDPDDPNLIVANFAQADDTSSPEDLATTLIHCVASNIAEDAAIMVAGFSAPRLVVYIGTPVDELSLLKQFLYEYSIDPFGLRPLFPAFSQYAGAIGALYRNDNTKEECP